MRLLKGHVILRLLNSYLVDSPQPANISYLWNFGSLLGLCLIIQILTGIFLAMHYQPHVDFAFSSVEHELKLFVLLFALNLLLLKLTFLFNYFRSKYNKNTLSYLNDYKIDIHHLKKNFNLNYVPNRFWLELFALNRVRYNSDFNSESHENITHPEGNSIPISNIVLSKEISETDFLEWFRGLTDGEGYFSIVPSIKF